LYLENLISGDDRHSIAAGPKYLLSSSSTSDPESPLQPSTTNIKPFKSKRVSHNSEKRDDLTTLLHQTASQSDIHISCPNIALASSFSYPRLTERCEKLISHKHHKWDMNADVAPSTCKSPPPSPNAALATNEKFKVGRETAAPKKEYFVQIAIAFCHDDSDLFHQYNKVVVFYYLYRTLIFLVFKWLF